VRLVPSRAKLVRAEISDRPRFARLIGAEVPPDWPPAEAADALPWFLEQLEAAGPDGIGWFGFYGVAVRAPDAPVLVGAGGSMGRPEDGLVEVGYSILPAFQRQGYATEMMSAVVAWLCRQTGVRHVRAETADDNSASRALLVRLGFAEREPGRDPGTTAFELSCAAAATGRITAA
jgi:RimJ/RimL family protein N-acetyltransferase